MFYIQKKRFHAFLETISEMVVWLYKKYCEKCVFNKACSGESVSKMCECVLPLCLSAVLTPAHLIDSTEPELIGPGRCEPAH